MIQRERNRGFTLLELMVTITVAAVILTFGVPGFTSIIDNNRATADTNDLITALNLARSEATRRGTAVSVCGSTNGTSCNASADWSTGWIVITAADQVLRVWPARSEDSGLVMAEDADAITFESRGSLADDGAVVEVRLPDCTGENGRDVSVNVAGRISVERVSCS